MWLEEQERGYSSNEEKTVCSNCFDEYGLKQFIEEHQTHSSCSYCETDNEVAACELDSLIEHILTSIHLEWGHPADEGLRWEGGWQFSTVYDIWDLLDNIGLDNIHGDTYEDICNSIHNQEWCERNPGSLSTDRTLFFGWQNFCAFIKNKARYVFFKAKNPDYDEDQHDEMDPVNILDALETIINKIGLVEEISVDTQIHRVRVVNPDDNLETAQELGSPPNEFATMANRMSPAGISMFYGAFDVETAIKETYEPGEIEKKAVSGIFEPIKPLSVIDLSEKLYIPSLFDEHERDNRDYMRFLFDFVSDFTRPIERSDRAHIDYVPTQVVTEYIRYLFKSEKENQIDGIMYPSSKNDGKKAIVIFANSDQCVESAESSKEGAILQLVSVETYALK
ncbi:hypothetical protein CRYPA_1043 [uncultured Candidatus Thioglobus sp.]|nr:hypothetical protein CRYPA_1043 [uncultured Candidatus Thioglobus sp.]